VATRAIRVGLIGFGTIGTGVIKLLQRQQRQIVQKLGARLEMARIADIDLKTDRGVKIDRRLLTNDAQALLDDPSIDIVIELMGGYEPARRFVLAAIANGKDVVTANKALLAVHGREIFTAAERAGVDLGFEASVGGGIPIIRVLRDGLAADHNRAVYGIVNGTSNYILSTMTNQGGEFGEVLRAAQQQGLAEANPTYDVDGIDAAHKLTLLIQLALGARVRLQDIPTAGIRDVSQLDINYAKDFGYVIKLLAVAKEDDGLEAWVQPAMVPRAHLLADVNGALNAIAVRGEALGASMYLGLGAGMMPTATAVVADLMEIARNRLHGSRARVAPLGYPLASQRPTRIKPLTELTSEFYLRFLVQDRPGVLARIAGILGEQHISIASVIQKGREIGATVPIVIRTHEAQADRLQRALRGIGRLAAVRAKPAAIRIEDSLGQ